MSRRFWEIISPVVQGRHWLSHTAALGGPTLGQTGEFILSKVSMALLSPNSSCPEPTTPASASMGNPELSPASHLTKALKFQIEIPRIFCPFLSICSSPRATTTSQTVRAQETVGCHFHLLAPPLLDISISWIICPWGAN